LSTKENRTVALFSVKMFVSLRKFYYLKGWLKVSYCP